MSRMRTKHLRRVLR